MVYDISLLSLRENDFKEIRRYWFSFFSEPSFESLTLWVEEYKHYTIPDKVVKILIGNKSDLVTSKKVESKVAKEFAEQYSMPFYEVSSKNDDEKQNIEAIFTSIAERLYEEKPVVLKAKDLSSKTSAELRTGSLQSRESENNVDLKKEKEKLGKEKKKCCGSGS